MSENTGSIGGSQARTSPPQFFFVVSIVLLLTVFLGFAPTFYLPRFFDTPSDQVKKKLGRCRRISFCTLFS